MKQKIIDIYVLKFYGTKLSVIKQLFNLKTHSIIYYYCFKIDTSNDISIKKRVEIAKEKYKNDKK